MPPAELYGYGKRLRVARIESGLALREASRFLEMPPSRLSDLENGREEPHIGLVERMFRVYGYFQGRKIAGREFTPQEIDSLWQEHLTRKARA
jgi:transcriptional regulator with XRE-family HTH domain